MKLAGVIFVICSLFSVGIHISLGMKKHCAELREILMAVTLLKNEISVCKTPLPQAFALMAAATKGTSEKLFSDIACTLNRKRWITVSAAMEQAMQSNQTIQKQEELCSIFRNMAAGIGKYDRSSQIETLDRTISSLELMIDQAEKERSLKSKTYEVLGLCAGLSLAILLL